MKKRYQVFISSTYTDLQEERREVVQALLESEAIPVGIELFPAADESAWSYIMQVINDCDYYVLIIGGRYGSIDEETGISFTEKEYDYAVSKNIPVIALLHGDPGKIPAEKTELRPGIRKKLDTFRERVEKERLCKYWKTTQELGGQVSRSFAQTIQRHPAVGWVRGNLIADESAAETINRYRNEIDDLKSQLDRLRKQGPPGIEKYSQGEEHFVIRYSFTTPFNPLERSETRWGLSWNRIFLTVALPLLTTASESTLRKAIEELIETQFNHQHTNVTIDKGDFETIKVQLFALGLIQGATLPEMWILTPFGNEQLLKLKAIART